VFDIIAHIRKDQAPPINILKADEQSARSSLANYFSPIVI